jgi:hypothetical protein
LAERKNIRKSLKPIGIYEPLPCHQLVILPLRLFSYIHNVYIVAINITSVCVCIYGTRVYKRHGGTPGRKAKEKRKKKKKKVDV